MTHCETDIHSTFDRLVIIELKRDGNVYSPVKEMLRELRIKPSGFSKYCIGSALTKPTLKQGNFKPRFTRIDKLLKSIKSRERKCRRYGKPDSEICSKCNLDRQFVVDLHDESKALQQEAANNLDLIDNYWSNHYEQTYSILSSYANMENFIYARKGCDNKILACIRIIDQCTRSMCSNLSFKKSSDWDFEDALIKQTASISVALKYISERL